LHLDLELTIRAALSHAEELTISAAALLHIHYPLMRILGFLQYSSVLIGIVAMIVGQFFSLRDGHHLGIFLIGAGIALGGLESLFYRQPAFFQSPASREAYMGIPAILWGIVLLILGGTVIASAYLLQDGAWHSTYNALLRQPAPLLGAGGLIAACIGYMLMVNPHGRRGAWWTLLVRIPKWIVGLLLLLGGLAAIGLGVWEFFEPQAYQRFIKDMRALLDPQALARRWNELPKFWQ
jgi:hypothetical protein